jgi:1,4-alpha-glucan branching enzyme
VAFLRRLNEVVYAHFPDTFTVAEESTAWPGVSRPTDQGGLGFGFKWDMGWMHDTLHYLAKGMMARPHHHDTITFPMLYHDAENYVLPLSHDEVVHEKRSLLDRMPGETWERFANLRLLYAWLFAHGGKKLLFMGGEFAQGLEWNQDTALDWDLLNLPAHKGIHDLVADLNALYRAQPALHQGDCRPGGFSWIDCGDRFNSVLTLLRRAEAPEDFLLAAFNFTAIPRTGYRIGVPRPGTYLERLNTDSRHYGGHNEGNLGRALAEPVPAHGHPQSLVLTLPPLSALFLQPESSTPS